MTLDTTKNQIKDPKGFAELVFRLAQENGAVDCNWQTHGSLQPQTNTPSVGDFHS